MFDLGKTFRGKEGHNFFQGRTEARWRPGQKTSLARPCSKLKCFGSKCAVLKVLPTLLGLSRAASDSTPGELCSLGAPLTSF